MKTFPQRCTPVRSWPLLRIRTLYEKETRQHSALYLYVSHPLSKKQATAGKPPVEIPTNNEHLCTADHRYKQKNINLIWRTGASALYPYSQAGARVQTEI